MKNRSIDKELNINGFSVRVCSQMTSSDLILYTSPLYNYHYIVQSYTGKYHEFVAVCIVTSNNANGNKRVIVKLDTMVIMILLYGCLISLHFPLSPVHLIIIIIY